MARLGAPSPVFTPPSPSTSATTGKRRARRLEPTAAEQSAPVVVRTLFPGSPAASHAASRPRSAAAVSTGRLEQPRVRPSRRGVAEAEERLRQHTLRPAAPAPAPTPSPAPAPALACAPASRDSRATPDPDGGALEDESSPERQFLERRARSQSSTRGSTCAATGLATQSPAWPWPRGVNTGWHSLDHSLLLTLVRLLGELDTVRAAGVCRPWRKIILAHFNLNAEWEAKIHSTFGPARLSAERALAVDRSFDARACYKQLSARLRSGMCRGKHSKRLHRCLHLCLGLGCRMLLPAALIRLAARKLTPPPPPQPPLPRVLHGGWIRNMNLTTPGSGLPAGRLYCASLCGRLAVLDTAGDGRLLSVFSSEEHLGSPAVEAELAVPEQLLAVQPIPAGSNSPAQLVLGSNHALRFVPLYLGEEADMLQDEDEEVRTLLEI